MIPPLLFPLVYVVINGMVSFGCVIGDWTTCVGWDPAIVEVHDSLILEFDSFYMSFI